MTIEANETSAPATDFLPGPILLLGAPGVGKGTQAKLLMAQLGIPQISTGEILRANIAAKTPLGLAARALMDQGELVADEIVNKMVANRLQEPDAARGFILDGYPRTEAQAMFLESILCKSGSESCIPLVAISIDVDESELLRRITGRRTCSGTGKHIYNIYSNPPKQVGVCDIDGSDLQQRSDDTEQVFHKRMDEYHAKTAAVVSYFSNHEESFRSVDGDLPIEQVQQTILTTLRKLRETED
ncbi:MAG: adenylate kinase [Acidobacteriaceae bacterium]|nr:adenylate kinase [Acidobacteriaceae bacterium]